MSGLGITLTDPGGLARTGKDRLAALANASPRGGRWAVLGLTVLCVAIGAPPPRAHACPAPVTSSRQSADDTIDHVTIAAEPRQLYIHMKSGRVYCYPLIRSAKIPPPGRGYEGTKAGVTLTIRKPGFSPYWTLALRGGKTSNTQAWRRTRARGRFRVDVIGRGAVPGKGTVPGESASARAIGVLGPKQIRQLQARGLPAGAAQGIAEKLAKGKALTVSEARALLDALSRSSVGQKHGSLVPSDRTWWLEWMRRHGGKADSLGDSPRRGKDSLSPRDVKEILAKHKEYVGVKDPPAVTARELRRRIPYDPALIRSWNGLAPWERDLWRAYWKRHPTARRAPARAWP